MTEPKHPANPDSGTHRGDDGQSDLSTGERRPKSDPVFETMGWIDDLQSVIGLLRVETRQADPGTHPRGESAAAAAAAEPQTIDQFLRSIQLCLSTIMAAVAGGTASPRAQPSGPPPSVTAAHVTNLQDAESELRSALNLKPVFFVPGDGSAAGALADIARARCRTAERSLAALQDPALSTELHYLNRLSDYLFVLARQLDDPQ